MTEVSKRKLAKEIVKKWMDGASRDYLQCELYDALSEVYGQAEMPDGSTLAFLFDPLFESEFHYNLVSCRGMAEDGTIYAISAIPCWKYEE